MTGDPRSEFEVRRARYACAVTRDLDRLSRTFEDFQSLRETTAMRLANDVYGFGEKTTEQMKALNDHSEVARLFDLENVYSKELAKVFEQHPLYAWADDVGLRGARVGRVVGAIRHPWRFPGQPCDGPTTHYQPTPFLQVGVPCPATGNRHETDEAIEISGAGDDQTADEADESEAVHGCPGSMLPPRTTTGVASVWHYFGLIPGADGTLISRKKGDQASYSPKYRALLLGKLGVADQIIRHRVQPYRDTYDEFKSRRQTDCGVETDLVGGLPPWRLNKIARIVAVKAWLGDLLVEWKTVTTA